ncbi:MAG: glycosyltransferase family 2 protein [Chitinophagaceae bacterium]|nr:glycosyltransferase family 2 protein [Chitinophagaceae bacterium]
MKDNPSVAIVILNWNTSRYLKRFLPSVLNITYENKRIYVVDNHSSDDSLTMLRKDFPLVNVIEMEANVGFASAYNYAISVIKCDYFLLLNSDIEATPGLIDPVIRLMEKDPKISICQPKLLSLDEKHMFEYAGACGGWIDRLGYPFSRGRVLLTVEDDHGQYDQTEEVFWASGACMFVKSKVFETIGGFYDYYYMHQEDIDLCWRAQNSGFKIYVCPEASVYHIGGGTLSWENHLKTFLTFRNNYILLTRNLPFWHWPPLVTLRLILDMAGCFYFIIKKETGISKAIIKAELAYLYWLFFYKKKKNHQPKGFKTKTGIYRGTILFHYFMNRRKFSALTDSKRYRHK